MSDQTKQALSIPGAIIIGAIIIGLAIVFAFGNNSGNGPETEIEKVAQKVGVNYKKLAVCVDEKQYASSVDADIENAQAMEASGTPHSIVVGPNDMRFAISGALPVEFFQQVIDIMKNETPRSSTTFDSNDLQEIYQFVMNEKALPTINNDLTSLLMLPDTNDHGRGSENPIVTIVEYSDIDCPFCARLHTTMQQVIDDNEDVQWVYRHLPIESLHPEAYDKALASECAYELSGQDDTVFWEYLDRLIDAK